MLPTLASEPFHRDGWIHEEKYNRWRIVLPIQSVFTFTDLAPALTRNRGRPWHAPRLPRLGIQLFKGR